MRRFPCLIGLLIAIVFAVVLLTPSRVGAITYGFVDSTNAYSNTGAFIVKNADGQIFPICSGTLIAGDVFLTASHCTCTSPTSWHLADSQHL